MDAIDRTVVILMDSVRRDVIGCYGGDTEFPFIDRMCNYGAVYYNHKSVNGWTVDNADAMASRWQQIKKSILITDNPALNESSLNTKFDIYYRMEGLMTPSPDIPHVINYYLDEGMELVFYWTVVTHAPYYSWGHEAVPDKSTLWRDDDVISYPIPHLQQSVEYIKCRYIGSIRAIDSILPQIKADKIILTADHGECFGEHGLWGHGKEKYPELLNIPLIVYGIGKDSINDETSVYDLYRIVWETMVAKPVKASYIDRLRELGYVST